MADKTKLISLERLQEFKGFIDTELAKKYESITYTAATRTLNFYKGADTTGTADFTVTLPADVDITGKIDKVASATAGNIVTLASDGSLVDAGKAPSDFAAATLVGTIPASATATDIVGYAQEVASAAQTAATYDDTTVKADIKANTDAITKLNGAATVEGSVAHTVAGEIAKVVAEAPEDFDTLKEIADWIANDTTGAAAMANDISGLKTTVGDSTSGLVKAVAELTAASGEANVLEGVQVNGADLAITDKKVNVTVATGATAGTVAVNGVDVAVKDVMTTADYEIAAASDITAMFASK